MKYLDYPRVESADPALRNFLVSLSRQDTIRRAKVAFPEYFTELKTRDQISLEDIRRRKVALENDIFHNELDDDESLFEVLFSWFGIHCYVFECRVKRSDDSTYLQLPPEFQLERDESYDPLSASFEGDFWNVQFLTGPGGTPAEHLVIKIQTVEPPFDKETKFFLTTILLSAVH